MPGGVPTSPQEFADMLTSRMVSPKSPLHAAFGEVVKAMLNARPEVKYQVLRQTVAGPVQTHVSLAQVIAELTDTMAVSNEIQRHVLFELQENRKIGEEVREQNKQREKRKRRREEEDEE